MKFVVNLYDPMTSHDWCFEADDRAAADAIVADYVAKCKSISDQAARIRSDGGLEALWDAHENLSAARKKLPFGFLMEDGEAARLRAVTLDTWFDSNMRGSKVQHLTTEEIRKMDAEIGANK